MYCALSLKTSILQHGFLLLRQSWTFYNLLCLSQALAWHRLARRWEVACNTRVRWFLWCLCYDWYPAFIASTLLVKQLLCVKFRLISLPLLDVSEIDFMIISVYSLTIFKLTFLSLVFVRLYNKYIWLRNQIHKKTLLQNPWDIVLVVIVSEQEPTWMNCAIGAEFQPVTRGGWG